MHAVFVAAEKHPTVVPVHTRLRVEVLQTHVLHARAAVRSLRYLIDYAAPL